MFILLACCVMWGGFACCLSLWIRNEVSLCSADVPRFVASIVSYRTLVGHFRSLFTSFASGPSQWIYLESWKKALAFDRRRLPFNRREPSWLPCNCRRLPSSVSLQKSSVTLQPPVGCPSSAAQPCASIPSWLSWTARVFSFSITKRPAQREAPRVRAADSSRSAEVRSQRHLRRRHRCGPPSVGSALQGQLHPSSPTHTLVTADPLSHCLSLSLSCGSSTAFAEARAPTA